MYCVILTWEYVVALIRIRSHLWINTQREFFDHLVWIIVLNFHPNNIASIFLLWIRSASIVLNIMFFIFRFLNSHCYSYKIRFLKLWRRLKVFPDKNIENHWDTSTPPTISSDIPTSAQNSLPRRINVWRIVLHRTDRKNAQV